MDKISAIRYAEILYVRLISNIRSWISTGTLDPWGPGLPVNWNDSFPVLNLCLKALKEAKV